jgi:predicted TIM-barrel fold metal-dependent hydrolase
MRVDAHCHVVQESWHGEPWWQGVARLGAAVLPGVSPEMVRENILPAYFDEDGSSQLGAMDAAGLDVAVMLCYDWTTEEHLGEAPTGWRVQNAWYRDFAAANPGRIRWGFGVDPRRDGAAEAFRTAVREEGAIALKLHPAGGFPLDDPSVYPMFEEARSLGVPVVAHVGPEPGPLYSKWAQPIMLDTVAADFPDVKFQAAHTGNLAWREVLAVAAMKPNVYCDLSGWQLRFNANPARFYQDVREVVDVVGAHRVMWSTDSPYYRAVVSDDDYLRAFTQAPEGVFTADEIESTTGGTAQELYGLG